MVKIEAKKQLINDNRSSSKLYEIVIYKWLAIKAIRCIEKTPVAIIKDVTISQSIFLDFFATSIRSITTNEV